MGSDVLSWQLVVGDHRRAQSASEQIGAAEPQQGVSGFLPWRLPVTL